MAEIASIKLAWRATCISKDTFYRNKKDGQILWQSLSVYGAYEKWIQLV